MRPLAVIALDEGVEARLLLQDVGRGRFGRLLLERQVHAFVAAVLLRATWLDAFDVDAEPEPPHRELGQAEQGRRAGKGDAVVGTDGTRQTAFGEQLFEGGDGKVLARGLERFAEKQEARRVVGDGR